MPTQNTVLTIFILPLLAALTGCQPSETTQKSATPAMQPHAENSTNTDTLKLAKEIGCLACHSVEKKLLGPAWKTVAAMNRDNATAEARLMRKITTGGSGVWGKIDMPAYPGLSEEKRRVLVQFILSLK